MPIRPTFAGILATLALAGPAAAQGAASPPPAAPPAAPATATPAASNTRMDRVTERRIEELHDKLKITPAQQKPFDDFASAMRDNARRVDGATARRANLATATAVEQMQTYADMAQAHAEDVQHLLPPFTTLYNALSPQQKHMADTSFREFSAKARARAMRS